MSLKFNLSDILKWINVERLIFSLAFTGIGLLVIYIFKKDIFIFFFTIEYLESITPVFQIICFICISYTILTFLSNIWFILYKFYNRFTNRNENGGTWKSR